MSTTSKLGADMLTDEQRQAVENAVYGRTLTQANVFALADLLSVRQPAAIDKQCTCKGVLGHSRQCAMFDESMMSIAAPLANEASKPAAQQTLSDGAQFFACYLIDNCENEVVREESVQAWLGKMLASPRYHPAAPSVEQDERGAFLDWWCADVPENLREGWKERVDQCLRDGNATDRVQKAWEGFQFGVKLARAASTSANVAQYRNEALSALLVDHSHAASAKDVDAALKARDAIYSMFANVAQGAEAVATVKVYETYTGQNGWIEVTQEEYDRTKDKYEHRIRRVPAPPAQTTLTDDARDAARYRWIRDVLRLDDVRWMNIANWNQANISAEVWDSEIDAALTAAQSASGDTNG